MFNNDDQDSDESYEQYTEETTIDWKTRIKNSCKKILIGILLFFFSFFILAWNEGRADLASAAKNTVQISSTSPSITHIGKFVSATGIITANDLLGDNLLLKPGKYIVLARAVEMYSWLETETTKTKINSGGSETKTTTYTYTKEWVDSEKRFNGSDSSTNSSLFRYPKKSSKSR